MKHTIRLVLIVLAVSSLLAGRNVSADPADAGVQSELSADSETQDKSERREGKEKRLEILKADLKLSPDQEAAWIDWVGKIKGDRKDWKEKRETVESWANLPAPERMEKMLAFSKARIAKQEARLTATKAFYATLSAEQRLILDKGFQFEHRGRLGNR